MKRCSLHFVLTIASLALLHAARPAGADRAHPFDLPEIASYGEQIPLALVVADFDVDGKDDVAVSFAGDTAITVYWGRADGKLVSPSLISFGGPSGTWIFDLAAADLDANGSLDLLALDGSDSTRVLTRPNTGSREFGAEKSTVLPIEGLGVPAWDVRDENGDGFADIIAPGSAQVGDVILAQGVGDGTFSAPSTFVHGHPVGLVISARVDSGTLADLISVGDSQVTVRMALGGGAYSAGIVSSVAGVRAAGDQDGDGLADLWAFANGESQVWRGNGDGTFAASTLGASLPGGSFAILENLDGDSDLDALVRVPHFGQDAIAVMRSGPGGVLQLDGQWAVGGTASAIGFGDFNGDGWPDVLAASRDDDDLTLLAGRGPGRFVGRTLQSSGAGAHSPAAIRIADMNRDHLGDLLFENANLNTLTLLHGATDGVPRYVQDIGTPTYPEGLEVAHLDEDGWPDVVVAGADGSSASQAYALGEGDGRLAPASNLTGLTLPGAGIARAGDFDRDGFTDIALNGCAAVRIAWGVGGGTFTPLDTLPSQVHTGEFAVGNYDADDAPDIVGVVSSDSIAPFFSRPGRTFERGPASYAGGLVRDLSPCDLNRDGKTDVVGLGGPSNDLVVLFGLGSAGFAPAAYYPLDLSPQFPWGVAVGDVDNDGSADIVVSYAYQGTSQPRSYVSVFYNDGSGGLVERTDLSIGPYGGDVALGDVDGDGRLDLAVANGQGSSGGFRGEGVSLILNAGPPPPVAVDTREGPQPSSLAIHRLWPNPTRRSEDSRFSVTTPSAGSLEVDVLDVQGRRVRGITYPALTPGNHTLALGGERMAPGLYFVRVAQGGSSTVRRWAILP